MRYNTSIGTEEGYEKRQQIRDTDINTHFSVWNQYAGADFFMQYTGPPFWFTTDITLHMISWLLPDRQKGQINWLMIPFFFMGALAGFTNIYKTVRKLYRQEEKKENHVKKD